MLEAAQRATGLTPGKARALLGRFLFSGADAEKPVAGLSGGERRRLSLAILVAVGREPADPRRAHQPPRPREPRGARGRAARVRRLADPGLPRPGAARRRGQPHDRHRGRRRCTRHQGGWADYVRVREERKAAAAAKTRAQGRRNGRRRESQQPKAGRPRTASAAWRRWSATSKSAESALAKRRGRARRSLLRGPRPSARPRRPAATRTRSAPSRGSTRSWLGSRAAERRPRPAPTPPRR